VSSAVTTTLTGHGARAWAAISRRTYSISPDLTLEPRAGSGERIAWYILIHVDGLGVLAEVVETRESARAVTLERSFSGMFPWKSQYVGPKRASLPCHQPYVPCQMLTSRKTELAWWELGTEKTLALFLFRRSLRITRHTVVVRSVVFRAFLGVALSHFHIVGAA
jgi:hypothetical protein